MLRPGCFRLARRTVVLVPLLVALACGDGAPSLPVVLSDSAGVRILAFERTVFDADTAWSVAEAPRTSIGVVHGTAEMELDDVIAAVRLADGSIVVADRGRRELLAFDRQGEFIRSLGGPGEGPGEFASINWLQGIAPDTLVAIDADLQRVTTFTLATGLVRTTHVPTTGYGWPVADARLSDGTFAFVLFEGSVLDRVGTDVAPGSTQETGELIHDRDGRLTTIVRWPAGDLTISDEHVAQFYNVFVDGISDPGERANLLNRLGQPPLPPTRAAYGRILVDDLGWIWISEAHLPMRAPQQWGVVNVETGDAVRVVMPLDFDLLDVGPDYLLGRSRDDLGVQRVQLLDLRRGSDS